MPLTRINGVALYWQQLGESGPAVVLVHGSWGDHHNWDAVAPALARSFRVLTYDRRGHSQSERPPTQGSIDEDVADLAALVEDRGFAPVHLVGNSFGAAISLRLAAARPALLASLAVHEPPLLRTLEHHPMFPAVAERIGAVLDDLRAGRMEDGARKFVETIAFGPGAWDTLPPGMRKTLILNAPTFLDESNEPDSLSPVDASALSQFDRPALVTQGDTSAPFFPLIVESVAAALPRARRHTFHGAGHVPHVSHPEEFVRIVGGFVQEAEGARQG